MSAPRQVLNARLVINCGVGRPQGAGFRYTTQPTARYECCLCGETEGPVTGAAKVMAFTDRIKSTHKATCKGRARTSGNPAATDAGRKGVNQ